MYIYVQAQDGTPLMPTTRAGKVRRILRDGKAVIVSHTPFTIRLAYETARHTQTVSLGVDAGSVHVVENLSTRREARRTRRNRLRYRAPRFNNRRRNEGWLPPSAQQKVHSHVKAVQDICKFLPVTSVTVEVAQFDMQKIKNPGIAGEDYQLGEQEGFWNVREYVLWRDNHKCQCCHGKTKDKVLNVHHIESRKTGSDSPSNLVTLCETCHTAYHRGEVELKFKRLFTSLRDAAAMNVMRWAVYNDLKALLEVPVRLTYGYKTKYGRINTRLEKSHSVDARCISGHPSAKPTDRIFVIRQIRRHNRKVMKSNLLKGGRWKRNQAQRDIKGFRLFDTVLYNNTPAYVHGRRSSGFFVIKDADSRTISDSVSYKRLKLIRHCNAHLAFTMPAGPV